MSWYFQESYSPFVYNISYVSPQACKLTNCPIFDQQIFTLYSNYSYKSNKRCKAKTNFKITLVSHLQLKSSMLAKGKFVVILGFGLGSRTIRVRGPILGTLGSNSILYQLTWKFVHGYILYIFYVSHCLQDTKWIGTKLIEEPKKRLPFITIITEKVSGHLPWLVFLIWLAFFVSNKAHKTLCFDHLGL